MPRPRKCRRVCCLPNNGAFGPIGEQQPAETVVMTVDEYETIRLIDQLGFTQEECAEQMKVARTTVQGTVAVSDTRKTVVAAAAPQAHHMFVKRGSPLRPREPLVTLWRFVKTTRMISEKPRVAMAR